MSYYGFSLQYTIHIHTTTSTGARGKVQGLRPISVPRFWGLQRAWLMQSLEFEGWNPQARREVPENVESTNLGRDNLSREIGRSGVAVSGAVFVVKHGFESYMCKVFVQASNNGLALTRWSWQLSSRRTMNLHKSASQITRFKCYVRFRSFGENGPVDIRTCLDRVPHLSKVLANWA